MAAQTRREPIIKQSGRVRGGQEDSIFASNGDANDGKRPLLAAGGAAGRLNENFVITQFDKIHLYQVSQTLIGI